jgi:hypothetical protein
MNSIEKVLFREHLKKEGYSQQENLLKKAEKILKIALEAKDSNIKVSIHK